MQEETGVPAENLRDWVWIGNQTHLQTTWRSRGSNPVRSGERRVIQPLHQPDLPFHYSNGNGRKMDETLVHEWKYWQLFETPLCGPAYMDFIVGRNHSIISKRKHQLMPVHTRCLKKVWCRKLQYFRYGAIIEM